MSGRDAALRVAVLSALLDTVKAEHAKAREAAEEEFRGLRADGHRQQAVMLPGGEEIGLISIRAGTPTLRADEDAVLAWAREHIPDGTEEVLTAAAAADPEVISMVKACFPGRVREQVRPSVRAVLVKAMTENGGLVIDEESGEAVRLGEVTEHAPTGAFSYRPGKGATDRVIGEWRAGRLGDVVFGPLALPGQGVVA